MAIFVRDTFSTMLTFVPLQESIKWRRVSTLAKNCWAEAVINIIRKNLSSLREPNPVEEALTREISQLDSQDEEATYVTFLKFCGKFFRMDGCRQSYCFLGHSPFLLEPNVYRNSRSMQTPPLFTQEDMYMTRFDHTKNNKWALWKTNEDRFCYFAAPIRRVLASGNNLYVLGESSITLLDNRSLSFKSEIFFSKGACCSSFPMATMHLSSKGNVCVFYHRIFYICSPKLDRHYQFPLDSGWASFTNLGNQMVLVTAANGLYRIKDTVDPVEWDSICLERILHLSPKAGDITPAVVTSCPRGETIVYFAQGRHLQKVLFQREIGRLPFLTHLYDAQYPISSLAVKSDFLGNSTLFFNTYDDLYAMRNETIQWKKTMPSESNLPLVLGETALYFTTQRALDVVDMETGDLLWRKTFDAPIYQSPSFNREWIAVHTQGRFEDAYHILNIAEEQQQFKKTQQK